MAETKVLTESELAEVQQYADSMKRQIIARLKEGKIDALQTAVEGALREEMIKCAREFFDKEIKEQMFKTFESQKDALLEVSTQALATIAQGLIKGLSEQVAKNVQYSWKFKKAIEALID